MKYDVVIWRGVLSDGSICYAAICPAVCLAHGQGDTEAEALSEVADAMACFLEREPDRIKLGRDAEAAVANWIADLTLEGVSPWVRQVAPAAIPTPV